MTRFTPCLESLDERLNLSPVPTGTVTFLVDGVNPSAAAELRPRFLVHIDRTPLNANDSIWLDLDAPVMRAADGQADTAAVSVTRSSTVHTITFGGSL